jgi:hypothetical protein
VGFGLVLFASFPIEYAIFVDPVCIFSYSWSGTIKYKRRRLMDYVKNQEHKEGPVARTIEEQTAKLPSDTFI